MNELMLRTRPALIAGIGAALCVSLLASMETLNNGVIWLMAPFGATMVILFGLPDSPLAQPRNIVAGHLLTTVVGVIVLNLFGVEPWSLGLAVGFAVMLMLATDTTHPPAGANPLLVMLTGQGWDFVVNPVLIGTLLIVGFGVLYHRVLLKRAYPKRWL